MLGGITTGITVNVVSKCIDLSRTQVSPLGSSVVGLAIAPSDKTTDLNQNESNISRALRGKSIEASFSSPEWHSGPRYISVLKELCFAAINVFG